MAEITGSEILAKSLKNEGTDILFFLMGGRCCLPNFPVSRKEFVRWTCATSNRPPSWDRPIAVCCRNLAYAWRRAVLE